MDPSIDLDKSILGCDEGGISISDHYDRHQLPKWSSSVGWLVNWVPTYLHNQVTYNQDVHLIHP